MQLIYNNIKGFPVLTLAQNDQTDHLIMFKSLHLKNITDKAPLNLDLKQFTMNFYIKTAAFQQNPLYQTKTDIK